MKRRSLYSCRYSIGYISIAEAETTGIKYAKIINKSGHPGLLDSDTIQAIMNENKDKFDFRFTADISDTSLPYGYPIVGYSYFIINMERMNNCEKAVELYRYIEWFLYDSYAAEVCYELSMAPLTPEIAQKVIDGVLSKLKCKGEYVAKLVQIQKENEEQPASWAVPVIITCSLCITLLLVLLAYIFYQQYKLRKALVSDEWLIKEDEISLTLSRSNGHVSMRNDSIGTSALSGYTDASYIWACHVIKIGSYSGRKICLRKFPSRNFDICTRKIKILLLLFKQKNQHINVLRFYGLTMMDSVPYIVSEHAQKGSLVDILQSSSYNLGDNFKFSIAIDVASGMEFLHKQSIIHGKLNTECCLLDAKWNVKVSCYFGIVHHYPSLLMSNYYM